MRNQSKCKACGADIARNTKICPSCGAKNRTSHPVFALIGCAIVLLICIPLIINMASEISPSSQGLSGSSTFSTSENEESQVIFQEGGIKITYTGMELIHYLPNQDDGYMLTINIKIENESDTDIVVLPMDSSVNDVMKMAVSGVPMSALSGKRAISNFSFANLEGTEIEPPSMDGVKTVSFSLLVKNNDTFDDIYQSDPITINP